MNNELSISYYLDKRSKKKNGKYPIKLRIYEHLNPPPDLISIGIDAFEYEFENAMLIRPKKEALDLRIRLDEILKRARSIANKLHFYAKDEFVKSFFRPDGEDQNVFYFYNQVIEELSKKGQIRTAEGYKTSMKSIKEYLASIRGKEQHYLTFSEITPVFLQNYEEYMLQSGKSLNTVSNYTRSLRALFRRAIDIERVISNETYPFGRNKYIPPATVRAKRGISNEALALIKHATQLKKEQESARDYWFLLFYCAGMNLADLAHLKHENFDGERFIYYRLKTRRTKRKNLTPLITPLTNDAIELLRKLALPNNGFNEYLFPILQSNMNETEKVKAIKNTTRAINHNMKTLAKELGINENIISSSARNTFITKAILEADADMVIIQQVVNHSDIRQTHGYLQGFPDPKIRSMIDKATKI